jgi:hypothetical protein
VFIFSLTLFNLIYLIQVPIEQKINGHIFDGLVSLTKLVIHSFYGMRVLRTGTFASLTGLEWLELENNGITSIEPGVFSCLTKLRRLELKNDKGGACPRLIELANLEILCLKSIGIYSLSELFSGMAIDAVNTKLQVLDLSCNNLTRLMANEFSRLVGLARLDLQRNKFESLENGAFSGLVNLQDVSLSASYTPGIRKNPLDLAVFGDELSLPNLRYLNFNNFDLNTGFCSSVKREQLFVHCRHRVLFQAENSKTCLLTCKLLKFLEQNSRISLIVLKPDYR